MTVFSRTAKWYIVFRDFPGRIIKHASNARACSKNEKKKKTKIYDPERNSIWNAINNNVVYVLYTILLGKMKNEIDYNY